MSPARIGSSTAAANERDARARAPQRDEALDEHRQRGEPHDDQTPATIIAARPCAEKSRRD
jgi:hypothetical protein